MRTVKLNVLLPFLVACVLVFLLDSRHMLDPIRSAAQAVAAPMTFSLYQTKLGTDDVLSFLKFWKSGEARIKNLEQRNLELISYENRSKALEAENAELRKQLAVSAKSAGDMPAGRQGQRNLLPAAVLGVGQYLEAGVGRKDGVREGENVIYLDNLVGKIIEVSERTSFVQLPTDSGAKIPVKIGRISGLATGQFNGGIILDRVAQNEEINVSDRVLTSGEGGGFEPSLVVGEIKKITSLKTDLFQRGEISPLIDFGQLTTVFVILD